MTSCCFKNKNQHKNKIIQYNTIQTGKELSKNIKGKQKERAGKNIHKMQPHMNLKHLKLVLFLTFDICTIKMAKFLYAMAI